MSRVHSLHPLWMRMWSDHHHNIIISHIGTLEFWSINYSITWSNVLTPVIKIAEYYTGYYNVSNTILCMHTHKLGHREESCVHIEQTYDASSDDWRTNSISVSSAYGTMRNRWPEQTEPWYNEEQDRWWLALLALCANKICVVMHSFTTITNQWAPMWLSSSSATQGSSMDTTTTQTGDVSCDTRISHDIPKVLHDGKIKLKQLWWSHAYCHIIE